MGLRGDGISGDALLDVVSITVEMETTKMDDLTKGEGCSHFKLRLMAPYSRTKTTRIIDHEQLKDLFSRSTATQIFN